VISCAGTLCLSGKGEFREGVVFVFRGKKNFGRVGSLSFPRRRIAEVRNSYRSAKDKFPKSIVIVFFGMKNFRRGGNSSFPERRLSGGREFHLSSFEKF
jgi:hypothetical protein